MALPSSGAISLSSINTELGRTSTATIGLQQASTGVYGAINTNSLARPSGFAPHSMSEWWGYDHLGTPNPLTPTGLWQEAAPGVTVYDLNTAAVNPFGQWGSVRAGIFYSSGVFAYEVQTSSSNVLVGFGDINADLLNYTGATATSIGYWGGLNGRIYANSTQDIARDVGGFESAVIRSELDFSTNIVSFYRNGVLIWSGGFNRNSQAMCAMASVRNGAEVRLLE